MKDKNYYLKEVGKLIRNDINTDIKNNTEKSEEKYLKQCLEYLYDLHKGWDSKNRCFKSNYRDEAYLFWINAKKELSDMIVSIFKKCKVKQMKTSINVVTAKALISIEMKKADLEYKFIGQQYRAKIEVKIMSNRKLTFFVSYKDLQEKLTPLVKSVAIIKENMEKLGKTTTIQKIGDW